METHVLISELKASVNEIPHLKKIREGFHNPHVKAWKTKLEELLQGGGTTCSHTLGSIKKLKNVLTGPDFIKAQTFINQLDALERNLKQTIHTMEVFGRPEDKKLPNWGKPKCHELAAGHLFVGEEEIATNEITIHEVLDCLVSLCEDSNDLTLQMRDTLIGHLKEILDDDLLQPFLSQKLDALLGHWPEFQNK